MLHETGRCQNQVRYLGFLWKVRCGVPLAYVNGDRVCPSCGWVRPPLPKLPKAVRVPPPSRCA